MQKTKRKSVLEWVNAVATCFLLAVVLFMTVKTVHAQGVLGEGWDKYLQNVAGFSASERTGEELAINFTLNLVRIVRNVVGAVALLMGVIYGLKLVLSRGQEEAITKQRTNFLWAFVGFGILIVSENVAKIFNPEQSSAQAIIDFNATRDQLRDIVDYLKWLLGSIIVLFMTVGGIRMITAGDNEEEITKQKQNLMWSFMGMLVILLANNIVNAVYVLNAPDEVGAAAAQTTIGEISGIIRLILVFLGPLAIAFTIYAGFLYLTALDNEERVNKSKKMIIAGVVAIVTIYGAYALVNTITSQNLTWLNTFIA